eukprot:CAMPEP_0182486154 /NCGR_PEP_ID=MMETSP1319-20130603/46525_1 /TAXON_ID=172717 /ORGANISM="Bolidomonas pacifica, Strain RCC208" /LENGTH=153 /DNA_ID=CAMNT_0024688213 /DNA_START=1 /DNA_END=458 /DNA_ORIENTATION=+
MCVLLLACDFWTVKNVTGRLLVGLRWWNNVREDGTNEWRYESLPNREEVSSVDHRIFWFALYSTPVVWMILLVIGLLKLNVQWVIIVLVALVSSGANIIGYYKCKKDANAKFQQLLASGALGALSQTASSSAGRSFLSSLFTSGTTQQQATTS